MNVLAALGCLDRMRESRRLPIGFAPTAGWLGAPLLGLLLINVTCACRGRDAAGEPPAVVASERNEAVLPSAAPELLAGFRITQPEFTYGALRVMSPRPLPQSLQVLLPSLIGLNPALSGRFSAGHDWLGAVTAEPNGTLGWAVGVAVTSGRELIAELSLGADAHLRASPRRGWTELTGSSGGVLGPLSLGVSGNYLVLGTTPTAVKSLAHWLAQPAGPAALAPEQGETGLSFKLFASGFALQAVHAHWRESWSVGGSPWSRAVDGSVAQVADVEALLNDGLSAYLGAIEGGDGHLLWQGQKLAFAGEFRGRALPSGTGAAQLCREIAGLPADVRGWVAGNSVAPRKAGGNAGPDWEQEPGAWQAALLSGVGALAASFQGRVHVKPDVVLADGHWLVGWREQHGASTALAILGGVPLAALETTPAAVPTKTGSRVQTRTNDGKVLEWAWAPRGNGIITAVGAQLGGQWEQWAQKPAGTGWPVGLSPSSCDGLVFAAGTQQAVAFSVSLSEVGMHVRGDLDLSAVGGLLQ